MTKSKILVVHGAGEGAHEEDAPLAGFVRSLADDPASVAYPEIKGLETLNWSLAATELKAAITNRAEGCKLVAHSLGGAAVLKLLSQGIRAPRIGGLFLIATPYKCKDGEWGSDDFALENDFADRLPDVGTIYLYHGGDDDCVPVDHVERYAKKLKHAQVRVVDGQGHQFTSRRFDELATDLRV
ncbi:MAG: alpha/beta hydrolase [Pseudomonadota bacterium]